MHFLLIILALLGIWKLLSSSTPHTAATLQAGLRRLGLVLAVAGGAFGGLIGYIADTSHSWMVPGAAIGFSLVWAAMRVLMWIVAGFSE